jgi:hypothetical protein
MNGLARLGCVVLTVVILAPRLAGAVAIGQVDTFENLTTQGWFVPGPSANPPSNTPGGGPAGPADAYLTLNAIGAGGAGGRLSALNQAQWSGDYLAAGVALIRMDVNNFGPDDLSLRLLFEDFDESAPPGPPINLALSSEAAFVPAGSGWTSVFFAIAPANLVALAGTAVAALSDTDTLRIFHNPVPTFPGPGVGIPSVSVSLGVDNITARAVPEPGTMALLSTVLVAAGLLRLVRARPR